MSDEWQSSTNDYTYSPPQPAYESPVTYEPPVTYVQPVTYEPPVSESASSEPSQPSYAQPESSTPPDPAHSAPQTDDPWTANYAPDPDPGRNSRPSGDDSSGSGGILGMALSFVQAAFGNDTAPAPAAEDPPAWAPTQHHPYSTEPHGVAPAADHRAHPITPEPAPTAHPADDHRAYLVTAAEPSAGTHPVGDHRAHPIGAHEPNHVVTEPPVGTHPGNDHRAHPVAVSEPSHPAPAPAGDHRAHPIGTHEPSHIVAEPPAGARPADDHRVHPVAVSEPSHPAPAPAGDHRAHPIGTHQPSHMGDHQAQPVAAHESPQPVPAAAHPTDSHRAHPIGDRRPTPADYRSAELRAVGEAVEQAISHQSWTGGSTRELQSGTGPQYPGGAFDHLRNLSVNDLQATVGHLDAARREALYAHLGEVDSELERERIEVALRARACASSNSQGRTIPLAIEQELRSGGHPQPGGAIVGLTALSHARLYDVLHVLPSAVIRELRRTPEVAQVPQAALVRQVLDDLAWSGGAMAAEDFIDVDAQRGRGRDAADAEMANIYNRYGKLIKDLSDRYGVDPSYVAAITKQEAAGKLFERSTDRATVRLEVHCLHREWVEEPGVGDDERARREAEFRKFFDFNSSTTTAGHAFRESEDMPFIGLHKSADQPLEQRALAMALGLAGDTALRAASFGAGQIMGFNHKLVGFTSAREMAEAFERSGRIQIESIFRFIKAKRLMPALRKGEFAKIAPVYNGNGDPMKYAADVAGWQRAYTRVTAGHRHGSAPWAP